MKKQDLGATTLALSLAAGTIVTLAGLNPTPASYAAGRSGENASATTQATPSGTPKSCPTPSGTPLARPTPSGTPVPGAGDINLLAGALGRALTDPEKTAITTAATTRDAASKAACAIFNSTVAATFSLTADELGVKIKAYAAANPDDKPGDLNSLLEDVLGRALTDTEESAITAAATARDTAIQATVTTYKSTVATALGLAVADLNAKVAAYRQSHLGSGQGGPGGGGPGGGPGGHH